MQATLEQPQTPSPSIFFTSKGHRRNRWVIDTSLLRPQQRTLLAGKDFEAAYLSQLESILYHADHDPKSAELLELVSLTRRIAQQGIVRVSCTLSVRRLPAIIAVLNRFFLSNLDVILSVSDMIQDNRIAEQSCAESTYR